MSIRSCTCASGFAWQHPYRLNRVDGLNKHRAPFGGHAVYECHLHTSTGKQRQFAQHASHTKRPTIVRLLEHEGGNGSHSPRCAHRFETRWWCRT